MSKNIIALVLCFVLCFTFIMPPERSQAIAFVPAMPVVLGLLKAAGLTAMTVGGANYLYNEFYNYIPSEMRTAIDSLNNGSVAVLAGGILSYLSPFALTKSMGENTANIENTGTGQFQLNTWYDLDYDTLKTTNTTTALCLSGLINTTNSNYYPNISFSSESTGYLTILAKSGTSSSFTHYYGFGPLKVKWYRNPTNLANLIMEYQYINVSGQYVSGTRNANTVGTFATLGYFSASTYLDRSFDYSGSISADRVLNPDGDIKPEAVIVPGSVQDFLNSAVSGDAMPSDYINAGAQDVAINGFTGSDTNTGDTTIDLSGTNTLLDGIKSLVNTISTGVGALTDFVVPDVTLDFSSFQNLGALMVSKFPFSIPWDIKNLIMSFQADPQPIVMTDLQIFEHNGKSYSVDLDLTEYSWLAAIVRYFCLAAFSLGLMTKTRDIIKS